MSTQMPTEKTLPNTGEKRVGKAMRGLLVGNSGAGAEANSQQSCF